MDLDQFVDKVVVLISNRVSAELSAVAHTLTAQLSSLLSKVWSVALPLSLLTVVLNTVVLILAGLLLRPRMRHRRLRQVRERHRVPATSAT